MPLGCAAASDPTVGTETDTDEATNSIEMVDEQITGCSVAAVFEGRSESIIDFIAVDVSELEQDNLELSLETIDEMGRRVVIETRAVLVRETLAASSSLDSLHVSESTSQSASQSSAANASASDTLSTLDSSLVQSQDQSSSSNSASTSAQTSVSMSEAFGTADGSQGQGSMNESSSSASQSSSQTASSSSDSAETLSTVDQTSNSQSSQSSQSSSSSSTNSELDQVSSDETLEQTSESSDISESSLLEESSSSTTMAFANLSQYRLTNFVLTANREVISTESSIRVFMGDLSDVIADESFDELIESCQ
jgi:hypothetical protein